MITSKAKNQRFLKFFLHSESPSSGNLHSKKNQKTLIFTFKGKQWIVLPKWIFFPRFNTLCYSSPTATYIFAIYIRIYILLLKLDGSKRDGQIGYKLSSNVQKIVFPGARLARLGNNLGKKLICCVFYVVICILNPVSLIFGYFQSGLLKLFGMIYK